MFISVQSRGDNPTLHALDFAAEVMKNEDIVMGSSHTDKADFRDVLDSVIEAINTASGSSSTTASPVRKDAALRSVSQIPPGLASPSLSSQHDGLSSPARSVGHHNHSERCKFFCFN